MQVELALFGPLREAVGTKTLEREVPEGTTVEAFLRSVVEEYPALREELFEDGELTRSLNVTRNKKDVRHLDGPDTELADGDVIRAARPVHGG